MQILDEEREYLERFGGARLHDMDRNPGMLLSRMQREREELLMMIDN
jgi:hypothetical protein